MIDTAHQLAQSAADSLSRRRFLGGLARAAAVAAVACGELLARPERAHAGKACVDSKQCPNGQVCFDGRCVRPRKK